MKYSGDGGFTVVVGFGFVVVVVEVVVVIVVVVVVVGFVVVIGFTYEGFVGLVGDGCVVVDTSVVEVL